MDCAAPGRVARKTSATLVLLLAAAMALTIGAPQADAQRGAHGVMGHAGFGGGHIMAGRAFGGARVATPPAASPFRRMGVAPAPQVNLSGLQRGFTYRPGVNGFRGGINDRRGFHRGFGRRRPFYVFGAIPGPYFLPPLVDYGLPYGYDLDDDDMANYGPAYQPGPDSDEQALEMNQAAMADQMQRMSAELNDLRSAQQYGPPQYGAPAPPVPYAPQPQYQPQSEPQTEAPQQPPVTLVLRNGQELKIRSYAVMNQTFWDFTNEPVHKIPLSSIDIAASQRATEANGGEFPAISTLR